MLGYDETHDLAMLKVQADDLTPIRLAEALPPLSTQIATIGRSPDPASITMTRGIVSAVGRLNGAALQIDAETNYANSGGAVIDITGACVGIVAHVRPDAMWGQNSGIGFATASAVVRRDMEALAAGKAVEKPKRGFMGITMSPGNIEVAGVVVGSVQEDGPADEAGIKTGDIITHVDGKPVGDAADLANMVSAMKPGTTVRLTVKRGQQTTTIELTLGENPY